MYDLGLPLKSILMDDIGHTMNRNVFKIQTSMTEPRLSEFCSNSNNETNWIGLDWIFKDNAVHLVAMSVSNSIK